MSFHETLQLQGDCAAMDHRRTAIEFSKIMKSFLFERAAMRGFKSEFGLGLFLLTESVARFESFAS